MLKYQIVILLSSVLLSVLLQSVAQADKSEAQIKLAKDLFSACAYKEYSLKGPKLDFADYGFASCELFSFTKIDEKVEEFLCRAYFANDFHHQKGVINFEIKDLKTNLSSLEIKNIPVKSGEVLDRVQQFMNHYCVRDPEKQQLAANASDFAKSRIAATSLSPLNFCESNHPKPEGWQISQAGIIECKNESQNLHQIESDRTYYDASCKLYMDSHCRSR